MKTARFRDVVAESGRPRIHLAFAKPTADAELKAAKKGVRLLTVHQQIHGGKKDFGIVGLEEGRDAQYLIFPKSLRRYSGLHIVAIQYDLLDPGRPAHRKFAFATKINKADVHSASGSVKGGSRSAESSAKPDMPEPAEIQRRESKAEPIESEVRKALKDLSQENVPGAKRRLIAILRILSPST